MIPGLIVLIRAPRLSYGAGSGHNNDLFHDFSPYCSSVTCSIHSTGEPFSYSWMAIWLMAVVAVAPCQCFSPGSNQTTSPARISSIRSALTLHPAAASGDDKGLS